VNPLGEGLWVCASGACDYFSDRKDEVPYEDARKPLDDFHPHLLKRIPPYCVEPSTPLASRHGGATEGKVSSFSARFPRGNKRFVLLILPSLGVNE
jgi:hypothetical protein